MTVYARPAYALIAPENKKAVHLKIGKLLFENISPPTSMKNTSLTSFII